MKQSRLGKETPVVVIGGPTASGKSALAVALAERLSGTVVNADAMQVYRELAILTARPSPAEMQRVPHRLYGILHAAERCTVASWRSLALAAIDDTKGTGRLPIVVGGTGLYLKALMEGLAEVPEIPPEIRAAAKARQAALGSPGLHAELQRLDPEMAARLKPGDTQRLIRAWEVITATGQSLSILQQAGAAPPKLWFVPIRLLPPRETLYAACDARATRMLACGALAEVAALRALGLDPELPAMKAVGVRELMQCLDGEVSHAAALAALQQLTRNYAKRQLTWFRHQLPQAQTWGAQFSESLIEEIFSFIRNLVDLN